MLFVILSASFYIYFRSLTKFWLQKKYKTLALLGIYVIISIYFSFGQLLEFPMPALTEFIQKTFQPISKYIFQ